MIDPWAIRGLQLDLARQMEPLSRILELLDLAAETGLTHVQLYLEGRVRLASFPGPLDGGAYGVAELSAIATHAQRRGIHLVPVVPGLAHADLVVARPEFAQLAEEREGRGRFNAAPCTFCPSLAETRIFLREFCTELCEVLPGDELHLGCDEVWNLGYCTRCAERAASNGLASIYVDHVNWLHGLARSLNRRLWLWDDVLEVFPEVLTELPHDICWSHWGYDEVIDSHGIQAHFVNRRRHRWLEQYTRLGRQAVVVPWALAPRNVETMIEQGHRHPSVVGAMLSEWEMAWRGWDERRAVVRAFAALCQQVDADTAWETAIAIEAPQLDPLQRQIAKAKLRQFREPLTTTLAAFLHGPLSTAQHDRVDLNELVCAALPTADAGLVHGLRITAEMDLVILGVQRWLNVAYDPQATPPRQVDALAALRGLRETCERIGLTEDRHLRAQRPGCLPQGAIRAQMGAIAAIIQQAIIHLEQPHPDAAILVIRYVLPDAHGLPALSVSVEDENGWREIFSGSPKPDPRSPGSAGVQIVPRTIRHPRNVSISGGGYGGIEVCWVEVAAAHHRWVPGELMDVEGPVDVPHRLKSDDSLGCRFGDADILAQLLAIPHAPRSGVVKFTLVAVESSILSSK